jgi:hypothetical protein
MALDTPQGGERFGERMTIGGNGIVTRRSPLLFRATVSRLEQAASALGAQLFGRIDHAANAKLLGKVLEPTELLLFGRPDASWPLMETSGRPHWICRSRSSCGETTRVSCG